MEGNTKEVEVTKVKKEVEEEEVALVVQAQHTAPTTSDSSLSVVSPTPTSPEGGGGEEEEVETTSSESATAMVVQSSSTSSNVPPSSSRLMRNLAEKMRRDKLNMYISELSSLVPIVAMATKRMDKTSVLRLSANFLRIHMSLKQNKKEKPKLAPEGLEASLSNALLEAIEGFMLIVTSLGKIVYISESVEKLLGHSQLDLMGQSLYTICHNGDHELLRHHLQPSSAFEAKEKEAGDPADYVPRSPSFFGGRPEEALSGLASGERRSFYARLAERSMARGDPARHVTVHLIGYLRPPNHRRDPSKPVKGNKECSSTTACGDEHLLVCVARPFRNKGITELSLMEAVQDEYVTRHLPDGRIIYSDHRIAFIAGYLTEEVMGLSAFNFIHQDDLPWATVANRQMFSSVEGQGYSVYRLRAKTGALIYLRTRGFLEFNKTTQKVETFVCINTLLTPEEGDKELEKERQRIQPFITFQQVTTTSTNLSSAVGGTPALTSSQTTSSVPVTTKTTTTVTMRQHRKDKALSAILSSSPIASTSTIFESLNNRVPIADTNPSTTETLTGSQTLLSPMEIVSIAALPASTDLHINGDSVIKEEPISPGSLVVMNNGTSSSTMLTAPSTTLSLADLELTQTIIDQNGQRNIVELELAPDSLSPSTSLVGTITTGSMSRLKRPFSDMEDILPQRTGSAKRPILPSAFISTYTPIHHTTPLGTKWGTETTTIIFDQHNNNG